MKGLVEALFNRLGLSLLMVPKEHSLYNEYLSLKVGKTTVGHLGSIHPKVQHHFDIKDGVNHASLLWSLLPHSQLILVQSLLNHCLNTPQSEEFGTSCRFNHNLLS